MNRYKLTDVINKQGEIFDRAMVEPVLLTQKSHPCHVLMSFDNYQKLIDRLTELEDFAWSQRAQDALSHSEMVGETEFTAALQELANTNI